MIDPRNSRTLFAGTFFGTGAFRSDDGGASWSPIDAGLSNPVIWALAITPQGTVYAATEGDSKPGGVFQSADGRTWRRTVRGLSTLEITALAVEAAGPGTPSILWAGTPSLGVFRSPNGGGVWRRVPIPGVSGPVNAIAVDPAHAGTAYVLAYERDGFGGLTIHLFKTLDAGRTWSRLPLPAGTFSGLTRDPRDGTLWVTGFGIARSTDGGLTWVAPGGISPADFLVDLAFDPSSPQVLYAAGYRPPPSRFEPSEGRLYKSTDGGASWTRTDAGLAASFGVQKVLVSPARSQVVYAASFGVLFRSADAGAHWDRVAEAPQSGTSPIWRPGRTARSTPRPATPASTPARTGSSGPRSATVSPASPSRSWSSIRRTRTPSTPARKPPGSRSTPSRRDSSPVSRPPSGVLKFAH